MEVSSIQKNNNESIRYDIEFHQTLIDISQNMVLKHLLLAISIKTLVEKDSDFAEAEMKAHPIDVIKTLREKLNLNVKLSD